MDELQAFLLLKFYFLNKKSGHNIHLNLIQGSYIADIFPLFFEC